MAGIPMHDCPHCDKRMPKHILKKHIAKRHNGGDKDAKEEKTKKEKKKKKAKETEKKVLDWDWGEITTCAACKERWPSKLMEHHVRLTHGL